MNNPLSFRVKHMYQENAHQWEEEWSLLAQLNHQQRSSQYRRSLRKAWCEFAEGRMPEGLRGSICASWGRSRQQGIDPCHFQYIFCTSDQLRSTLSHNALLIQTARDTMRNLLAYNPDGHINLTDASGITLCFCGQDLTPVGSILRENVLGTNCSGRCLAENRLVYLLSEENYKQTLRERGKHCAAAPIHDGNGNMLGALTLTADPDCFHYHTLGTVQAAAEAVSQQLILHRMVEEQKSVMESLNEGVIVVDTQGAIRQLNRYARQVLMIGDDMPDRNVDEVLRPEGETVRALPACKDRNITFCPTPSLRVPCLISVIVTPEGGRVISLRESRRTRDITRRVLGSSASYSFDMILGQSQIMQDIRSKAYSAGRSDSTVLLTGESGTGKELFAQSIHNSSSRAQGPFLALNCGAIPRDLVQSELFGYEEGAFTSSRRGGAAGKFELADGGTLFLDEIGDMPLEAQASLLRVLQENEVTRLGGKRPLNVDVRIIAATHRDLNKEVESGAFRRDLYFRLNVISLTIPPLRARREDIKELAHWFCEKICRSLRRDKASFSAAAVDLLEKHSWPGNVRELENIVERTLNMMEGQIVDVHDLPDEVKPLLRNKILPDARPADVFSLKSGEKHLIELCLAEKKGNLRQVAFALSLSRGALYNKLKRYGIDADRYRKQDVTG
ncbi:sigma-54 interaction domain-containing protein [Erwinia mallotivora]|uniref:sigma-54 interaction domain-containing protein n=1 Tax=Erwinia mallotivora TaxID=69222 RepID=UPI0035EF50D6